MLNQRPTLLDLYLTNLPDKFGEVSYYENLSSEHKAISIVYNSSGFKINLQFRITRKYNKLTRGEILSKIAGLISEEADRSSKKTYVKS